MSELGKRIARARKGAGFTQMQLGNLLAVESITVSRWERGVTSPSLGRLRQISTLTKVPMTEFVLNDGAPDFIEELRLTREAVDALRRELEDLRGRKR